MKIQFLVILLCVTVHSLEDDPDSRKHYGLSFHNNCKDYIKAFKCMTACKSIGFQVYRLNFKCKCSCHELKTSTILPFFKWRTNGTTKRRPRTYSPQLYHIVDTLSPPPAQEETTLVDATVPECETKPVQTVTETKDTSTKSDASDSTNGSQTGKASESNTVELGTTPVMKTTVVSSSSSLSSSSSSSSSPSV